VDGSKRKVGLKLTQKRGKREGRHEAEKLHPTGNDQRHQRCGLGADKTRENWKIPKSLRNGAHLVLKTRQIRSVRVKKSLDRLGKDYLKETKP